MAKTHGAYLRHEPLAIIWSTMLHRCENPKRTKYPDYGGRGISVCAQWHDPNSFIDWALLKGYEKGLQLDRINNDGNYCPENCRFVTPKQNSRNRRDSVVLCLYGTFKTVAEWVEGTNISAYTVYWWIKQKGKDYAERKLSERLR